MSTIVSHRVHILDDVFIVRVGDSLRDGQSGDRNPVEARFSASVQPGPGTHPASYTKGTGSFPGGSGRGVALTTHSHLVPRL